MLHGPRQPDRRSIPERATAQYLNEHLARLAYCSDLAGRLRDWTAGTGSADERLGSVAVELGADRLALVDIMRRLGVARDPARQAGAWFGERVSRLRLSAPTSSDEPTALLMSLETLLLGIEDNLCMWRTLRDVSERRPSVDGQTLEDLIARAQSQREQLQQVHAAAAAAALGDQPQRV